MNRKWRRRMDQLRTHRVRKRDRAPPRSGRPIGDDREAICREIYRVADREGFEPSRRLPAYTRSRRAPSTTRPPVHTVV